MKQKIRFRMRYFGADPDDRYQFAVCPNTLWHLGLDGRTSRRLWEANTGMAWWPVVGRRAE